MESSELIRQLTADLAPASPSRPLRELALSVLIGGAVSTAGLMVVFGVQPGLLSFRHAAPLVMKLAFVACLLAAASSALTSLARAGAPDRRVALAVLAPVAILLALGALQILLSPPSQSRELVLGGSYLVCPLRIAVLALPLLAGLLTALRRQAPVRLAEAGAAAGLVAGAAAAGLYALACPENGALFVALWYSAGIGLVAALGAGLGARLLSW